MIAMNPTTGYPQTDDEIHHIRRFCFPRGFQEVKQEDAVLRQFVFYIQQQGYRHYGICLHLHSSSFAVANRDRKFPLCLCLLSRTPFISSHIQFLTYVALLVRGKPVENDFPPDPPPTVTLSGNPHPTLALDPSYPGIAIHHPYSAPPGLFDALFSYQHLTVSRPIALSDTLELCVPFHFTHLQCLSYPTLDFLYSTLSPEIIAAAYSAILLEFHVLFFSKDIELLTFSVIAATALARPFHLSAMVLPVIPRKFREFIESPFPYIFGSTKLKPGADVVVDLDNDKISFRSLPSLPRASILVAQIQKILEHSKESILVPEKGTQKWLRFMETTNAYICRDRDTKGIRKYIFTPYVVEDLLELFRYHLAPGLRDLIKVCLVSEVGEGGAVTVVNRELLLKQFKEEELEFWNCFLGTQMFEEFSNEVIGKHVEERFGSVGCDSE
jgi:hypothetical protein